MDIYNLIMTLLVFGLLFLVYFTPTILANRNRHRNGRAIFAINLFLGWTLLGWVGALVWAVYREREAAQ